MKFTLGIILAICISNCWGKYTHGHDGKPKCIDSVEIARPWRNNFDPTRYWVCESNGNPVAVLCPAEQGYMDKLGCVDWANWYWEKPYDPPSVN